MQLPDPEAFIRASGPWAHRDIAANGSRFHVVDSGEGPMVLLLHGFPTFWWTWRRQVASLAAAGFRVVAMDLRGYGGSDHPPEGYDPRTSAADVAGVIRSLGEEHAVVVGHGLGGLVAWSACVLEPETISAIAPVSVPHPRQLRRALLRRGKQRAAMRYALPFQVPFLPENRLARHDAERIVKLMSRWSADTGWLDETAAGAYRAVFMRWPTPHTAVEYHRWGARSAVRPDGLSYMALMSAPIRQPVLQIHGSADPMMLPASVDGSESYVRGAYERVDLNCGHFPHEELPEQFTSALLNWLRAL